MGKIRRYFKASFKQQVMQDIEAGVLTLSAAARKYQVSVSVLTKWRVHWRAGTLVDGPSTREKALEAELARYKAKVGELTMEIEAVKKMQVAFRRLKNGPPSLLSGPDSPPSPKGAGS